MRKKPATGVLESIRASTYGAGKCLFTLAMGGWMKTVYDSPLRLLRPCWMAFFTS